jgi:hypothetical protein
MLPGSRDRLAAPELHKTAAGERLLELAERYCAVVQLPDDVEALWRAYQEQQRVLLGMAVVIDRLEERLAQVERRQWRQGRRP